MRPGPAYRRTRGPEASADLSLARAGLEIGRKCRRLALSQVARPMAESRPEISRKRSHCW